MEKIEQIFRHSAHLKILLLYHKNNELITTIGKLAEKIGMSQVSVRNAVNDLAEARVLDALYTGRRRVIRIANTTQAQLVFSFIEEINNAEEKQRFVLSSDWLNEAIGRPKPRKLKDVLSLCHKTPHYKYICDALQTSNGEVEELYQEYCALCKSKNVKPLKEVTISGYLRGLVREGKVIQDKRKHVDKGRYRVKEKVGVEDRSRR